VNLDSTDVSIYHRAGNHLLLALVTEGPKSKMSGVASNRVHAAEELRAFRDEFAS
jgi:hypothetical protein